MVLLGQAERKRKPPVIQFQLRITTHSERKQEAKKCLKTAYHIPGGIAPTICIMREKTAGSASKNGHRALNNGQHHSWPKKGITRFDMLPFWFTLFKKLNPFWRHFSVSLSPLRRHFSEDCNQPVNNPSHHMFYLKALPVKTSQ